MYVLLATISTSFPAKLCKYTYTKASLFNEAYIDDQNVISRSLNRNDHIKTVLKFIVQDIIFVIKGIAIIDCK